MLISHRKNFIFTKTIKTAGTSVESYFEKYCMEEGQWERSHKKNEHVSKAGIIGYRGSSSKQFTWFNHMSAEDILKRIGPEIWNNYFKFTIVRNPYEKLISAFFMLEKFKQGYNFKQKVKAVAKRILDKGAPIDRIQGKTSIERFRCWVRKGGVVLDRDKYTIQGKECMDYIIRFEDLNLGLEEVCRRVSVPFVPSDLPTFKKGVRPNNIKYSDFYDAETIDIVQQKYAWEIEKFNYLPPK